MFNGNDTSKLIIRLESLYLRHDKSLSDFKAKKIVEDLGHENIPIAYIFETIEHLTKSDRDFKTRDIFNLSKRKIVKKVPDSCEFCNTGYTTKNIKGFGAFPNIEYPIYFACNCDSGKYRHDTEKMVFAIDSVSYVQKKYGIAI